MQSSSRVDSSALYYCVPKSPALSSIPSSRTRLTHTHITRQKRAMSVVTPTLSWVMGGGRGGMWPGRLSMQLKLVFTQYRIIRVPLYSRANRTISGRIPPGRVDFHDREDQGRGSRQCPDRRIYDHTGNGAECKPGPVGAMLLACWWR